MLEILFLMSLTKRIGAIVENKGYKSGGYKLLLVVLWFGGEVVGGILGSAVTGGDGTLILYLIALIGAAIGAGVSFAVANNLPVVGTSLTTEDGQPVVVPVQSVGMFHPILLGVLWLLTNTVANVGWSMVYRLVNPNYEESLLVVAAIISGTVTGLIAGALQFLLLTLALPNRNRMRLALWVIASMAGWAISMAAFNLLTINSEAVSFFIYLASGLEIGILQWLILQRHSRIAYWWILASMLDWVLNWAVFQSSLWQTLNSEVAYNIISGLISWIPTSIAIAILLGSAFLKAEED